jgi:leucine dehydrogenase
MPAIWDLPDFDSHEAVHVFEDRKTGLKAVIAVHSTHLGPAAGGTRFWHYADSQAAITDALRLSRGMSYKNAMAELPAGGGKAVILANPSRSKPQEMLDAFARAVDSLGGQYITAQDVGMSEADMVSLSKVTPHVAGLPDQGGDPGPYTARGVYLGVKAAAKHALGTDDMAGVHVAIQGVGSVGGGLARYLAEQGARLTLADVDAKRSAELASELGGVSVAADAIMDVEADIFSPCALGAILTASTVAALKVKAVAARRSRHSLCAGLCHQRGRHHQCAAAHRQSGRCRNQPPHRCHSCASGLDLGRKRCEWRNTCRSRRQYGAKADRALT